MSNFRKDINCPYCDHGIKICNDDGFRYEEDTPHEIECDGCGKNFIFRTSIHYFYESEKADCLNDGKHDWHETNTRPQRFTKLECSICEKRKSISPERLSEIIANESPEIKAMFSTPKETP